MKLDELINKHYDKLNESDFHIWNYISNNREECQKLVIDQLAYKCNVSRTTILRFAQKISLKGYSELKLYLKLENQEKSLNTEETDIVCENYYNVIKQIRNKDCKELFEKIESARNIYVYGQGMVHSSIKKELKRVFMTAGKVFYDLSGYQESEISLNIANTDDLFIIISVSGENKFLIDFTSKLKVRSIPILSITKMKENTLAQMSDYNLYISSTTLSNTVNNISYESITSYFILIEILFLKYIDYLKGKEA